MGKLLNLFFDNPDSYLKEWIYKHHREIMENSYFLKLTNWKRYRLRWCYFCSQDWEDSFTFQAVASKDGKTVEGLLVFKSDVSLEDGLFDTTNIKGKRITNAWIIRMGGGVYIFNKDGIGLPDAGKGSLSAALREKLALLGKNDLMIMSDNPIIPIDVTTIKIKIKKGKNKFNFLEFIKNNIIQYNFFDIERTNFKRDYTLISSDIYLNQNKTKHLSNE